jgi:hypothetical protein
MLGEENVFVVRRFGLGPPSMSNPAPVAALSTIAYSAALGLVECVAATTMPSRCAVGLCHPIEPRNSLWSGMGRLQPLQSIIDAAMTNHRKEWPIGWT